MNTKREGVKTANPELTFGTLTKKLTEMWKALTDEERKIYEDMAVKDKERYYTETEARGIAKHKAAVEAFEPKRPVKAFVHFSYEARARIKKVDDTIERTLMLKRLAIEWSELPEDEKNKWRVIHKKDKERYARQIADKKKGILPG